VADLVGVRLDSVRTAGVPADQAFGSATAADVHAVVVGGREVVRDGAHVLGDVAGLLSRAVTAAWG
jgi:cytosine/adenosine deaminase-related metal-dependent hydrolase